MSGDGVFRWWVGRGEEPEAYYSVEDTREAAIQVGKSEMWPDGDGFTIVEADKAIYQFQDGHRLFEEFCEVNEENGGEDGFGADISPDAEQYRDLSRLFEAMFRGWMQRHNFKPHVFQFGTQRNEEYFHAETTKETTE